MYASGDEQSTKIPHCILSVGLANHTKINEEENNSDRFSEVRCQHKKLFSPKSGLSEFYVWKDNCAEKKR